MENKAYRTAHSESDTEIITSPKKWLYGLGASAWFAFRQIGQQLHIRRYSPEGKLECTGIFKAHHKRLELADPFAITYPSHCAKVTLVQNGEELIYPCQQ
jgi:hypothetical protein